MERPCAPAPHARTARKSPEFSVLSNRLGVPESAARSASKGHTGRAPVFGESCSSMSLPHPRSGWIFRGVFRALFRGVFRVVIKPPRSAAANGLVGGGMPGWMRPRIIPPQEYGDMIRCPAPRSSAWSRCHMYYPGLPVFCFISCVSISLFSIYSVLFPCRATERLSFRRRIYFRICSVELVPSRKNSGKKFRNGVVFTRRAELALL